MYSEAELLEMIINNKASVRYEACEGIRIRQYSSPKMINALVEASRDLDKEVAERAKLALQSDVHRQMAIKMGIGELEKKGVGNSSLEVFTKRDSESSKIIGNSSRKWFPFTISPETHAILTGLKPLIYLLSVGILVCRIFLYFIPSVVSIVPLLVIIGIILLTDLIFTYLLPVRCNNRGCSGRMKMAYTRKSRTKATLHYRCNKCDAIYQTDIFILPQGGGGSGGGGGP